MLRLILFVVLLAALAIAFASVMAALRAVGPLATETTKGDSMPQTIRNIAYVLLILLMCGVSLGWLGAA